MAHPLIKKTKQILELQFIRYLIIGTISFLIDFSLFNLFVVAFEIQPLPANMTSIAISVIFNFLLSNYWTFKAGNHTDKNKIAKYLVIVVFNYIVNNLILYFLTSNLALNPILSKILVTILQISWTFFLYKIWVFKIKD